MEVEDLRRQERALQGNVQQLTLDNAFLQREEGALQVAFQTFSRQGRELQGNVQQFTQDNSRLTQDNARLQREVEALEDVRRQERELQGNVQQLTQDNPRLTQDNARLQTEVEALEDVSRQERALQGNVQQLTQENARLTQLTQQLQQQERQRIAQPNGDGGQSWNLSLKTGVSIVLVICVEGLGSYCTVGTRKGTSLGAVIATAACSVAL